MEDRPPTVPLPTPSPSGERRARRGRNRRRRIQTACKSCQDRKTRCDGCRPSCSACYRRGLAADCAYDDPAPWPSHGATLEQRLLRLEQEHQRTTWPTAPIHNPGAPIRCPPVTGGHHGLAPLDPRATPGNQTTTSIQSPSESRYTDDVDGLATVPSTDESEGLYGASSTIAFVQLFHHEAGRQGATAVDSESETTGARPDRGNIHYIRPSNPQVPEAIRDKDPSASLFPSRQTADDLTRCFWEFVHPVFPVLHKTSFMEQYGCIWSAEGREINGGPTAEVDEAIFNSTLNIVFALGCRLSEAVPTAHRASLAQSFYQRSRAIYRFEILDSASLPLVQMLLLTGVYLQSNHQANRCWNVIGLAIRAAQSLGLHVESAGSPPRTQMCREMRRRVWHLCLILDKLLSMTFGRPAMISTTWKVPLPSLIDDEYLSTQGEGEQPHSIPSRLGLCIWSSKLFLILDDILLRLYAPQSQKNVHLMTENEFNLQETVSDVIVLNRRLDEFFESIPTYLRVPTDLRSSTQWDAYVVLQQQVLYCRYLYTRVLSLRPLLLLTTRFPSKFACLSSSDCFESLDMDMVRRSCNLCVTTASRLIETIHQNLESNYRCSGWHSVYFTFASAVVLLASRICPATDTEITSSFDLSWSRCLLILEYYKDHIQAAKRATPALQELKSRLDVPRSQEINSAQSVLSSTTQFPFGTGSADLAGLDPLSIDSILGTWLNQDTGWLDFQ